MSINRANKGGKVCEGDLGFDACFGAFMGRVAVVGYDEPVTVTADHIAPAIRRDTSAWFVV